MFRRYDSFHMAVSNDSLAFESTHAKGNILVIDKKEGEIRIDPNFKFQDGKAKKTVQGILGMAYLPLGKVVVVITKKYRIGEFDGQIIWRLEACDILPLHTRSPRSGDETEAHKRCLGYF